MSVRDLGQIVMAPIGVLRDDPENPKIHTADHVDMVAASIQKFGFSDPVGVVTRGLDYMIVEGHGRVMAAKQLGLTEVPVILLDHLNDVERRAYGVAHNQCQQNSGLTAGTVAEEFDRIGVTSEDWQALGYTDEDALFLPNVVDGIAQVGWQDSDEETNADNNDRGGGDGKKVWKEFVPTVHRTTFNFNSDIGYQRFVRLLEITRESNPQSASIGQRMGIILDQLGVARPQPKGDGE